MADWTDDNYYHKISADITFQSTLSYIIYIFSTKKKLKHDTKLWKSLKCFPCGLLVSFTLPEYEMTYVENISQRPYKSIISIYCVH